MIKQLLHRLFLIAIFAALAPAAYAYDFDVDGIYYTIVSDSTANVTYYSTSANENATVYKDTINIPASITYSGNAYNVIGIEESAFNGCTELSFVTIPNSVEEIGSYAFFGCSGLTSITLPNSVTYIDGKAFLRCLSLESVTFEDGTTVLHLGYNSYSKKDEGEGLFYGCPLQTLYIGRDLSYSAGESYGYSPFSYTKLTSVTISNNVTSIPDYAFHSCSGIKSVTIEDGETTLSLGRDYSSYSYQGLFYAGQIQTLYIGRNLSYSADKSGGYSPFYGSDSLKSVTISNNVTSIPNYAFYLCGGLTSITLPNSVEEIGSYAFFGCSGLTSITLPNSVEEIGSYAFYGCSGLTSITLPNSVAGISSYAFYGCSGLTSITLPNSVAYIGSYAFYDCRGLTSITTPNSVKVIGSYAFYGCRGLTSITIPNSVTSVGDGVFYGCYNLLWSNSAITHSTITWRVSEWNINGAEYGVYYKGGITKGDTVISGLHSGTKYDFYPVLILPNGNYSSLYGGSTYITTKSITLDFSVDSSVSPTTISGVATHSGMGDAIETICSEVITGAVDTVAVVDSKFSASGLDPNTSYTVTYNIKLSDGRTLSTSKTVKTAALTLTTVDPPKVVSSGCAIVAATTNISDEETNAGFQWRKYDAPESLKSNEAYAAIYDGQLEGYIKNLQSTSYYNVRAFYKSAAGTYYYGDWVTFDPSDFSYFEPTVHTYDAISVTDKTAQVKGYVMQGTDEVTEQGFEYWKTGTSSTRQKHAELMATSTTASDGVSVVLTTGQVMTVVLEDLEPSTTYIFRAFVKTASGTTYGEEQTFTTAVSTGIGSVTMDADTETAAPTVVGYYDLQGRRLNSTVKGLNIIRYSDGTSRKVLVK